MIMHALICTFYFIIFTIVTGSAEGRALSSTWYLISDSLELRQAAQRHFGAKLLTDDTYRPIHTYCPVNSAMGLPCGFNQEERIREATVRAAGDLLSFALTDYHIFSRESGFGRVGAWLANSLQMHSFSQKVKPGQVYPKCSRASAESHRESANQWTGIRR
jgi:hypothetical protein